MARMMLLAALMPIVIAVGGCTESKSEVFAACYEKYVGYYLGPRPQGRPPDEYLMGGLTLCMYSKGYAAENKLEARCSSPHAVTADCFQFQWLRAIVRTILGPFR